MSKEPSLKGGSVMTKHDLRGGGGGEAVGVVVEGALVAGAEGLVGGEEEDGGMCPCVLGSTLVFL